MAFNQLNSGCSSQHLLNVHFHIVVVDSAVKAFPEPAKCIAIKSDRADRILRKKVQQMDLTVNLSNNPSAFLALHDLVSTVLDALTTAPTISTQANFLTSSPLAHQLTASTPCLDTSLRGGHEDSGARLCHCGNMISSKDPPQGLEHPRLTIDVPGLSQHCAVFTVKSLRRRLARQASLSGHDPYLPSDGAAVEAREETGVVAMHTNYTLQTRYMSQISQLSKLAISIAVSIYCLYLCHRLFHSFPVPQQPNHVIYHIIL